MKVILAVVLCAIVISISCNERIIIERDNPNMIYKVKFLSEDLSETIKTIDLNEMNPYKNLPFEKLKDDKVDIQCYKNVPLDQIFSNTSDFKEEYVSKFSNSNTVRVSTESYLEYDYVIIKYDIMVTNFGKKTTIFIFNDYGEKIYEIIDSTKGIKFPKISQNGKFLFYQHGYDYYSTDRQILKQTLTYSIIDIKNNVVLATINPVEGSYYPPLVRSNVFILESKQRIDNSTITNYSFYDIENKMIYSINLTEDKHNNLITLSSNGLVYQFNGEMISINFTDEEFIKKEMK